MREPLRWEWRTFGCSLAGLEARLGLPALIEPHHSDEVYLLNSATPHSAKIRGGALEIKRLEQVDPNGLELWGPVFKAAFPLTPAMLREAFSAWGLPPPAFRRDAYPLDLFLSDIIERDAAFRTVAVNKARRQFVFRGCTAEFVHLRIGGIARNSFCIEDETPERILAALRELGLDSQANVNFPRGLEQALIGLNEPSPRLR